MSRRSACLCLCFYAKLEEIARKEKLYSNIFPPYWDGWSLMVFRRNSFVFHHEWKILYETEREWEIDFWESFEVLFTVGSTSDDNFIIAWKIRNNKLKRTFWEVWAQQQTSSLRETERRSHWHNLKCCQVSILAREKFRNRTKENFHALRREKGKWFCLWRKNFKRKSFAPEIKVFLAPI